MDANPPSTIGAEAVASTGGMGGDGISHPPERSGLRGLESVLLAMDMAHGGGLAGGPLGGVLFFSLVQPLPNHKALAKFHFRLCARPLPAGTRAPPLTTSSPRPFPAGTLQWAGLCSVN
jgi:hypothetical protein